MNIGRTVRVFRAEPVLGPVPEARTRPETRADEVVTELPVGVEMSTPAPPAHVGG